VQERFEKLIRGLAAEGAERNDEQQAQWLLAHLLDWHRREEKSPWWEFFRLRDLTEEELLDEKAAVGGLRFEARVSITKRRIPTDQYSYPPQATDLRRGDRLNLSDGNRFGTVEAIDRERRRLDVKKIGSQADVHPTALFAHSMVNSNVLADALLRLADDVIQYGITDGTQYRAARDILLRRPPRLSRAAFLKSHDETAAGFAIRV
jgi:uncharacterized protein